MSLPSTSHGTKESSLSSYSVPSSGATSDSDDNPRQSGRSHSKKSGMRAVAQKYKRSYGPGSRNKPSKKRKISSSSDSSSCESTLHKKYSEKRVRKTRYRVQAKGTGRIKLIKKEDSYSDEDSSSSDSSSTETDNKTKGKKNYREYKSKKDSSANNHTAKSGKTTKSKEKTLSLEKSKSKNKDPKCSENGQSRSRSNSTSSNTSERDKRPDCRHRESRNANECGSLDDSASINKDMPRSERKSKSKKRMCYPSDSEDDRLRSSSQCSNYSNKSYSNWKKSKRKEKHKNKERHRPSGRIFNLSQSNASTILKMSISSKNDTYPTKHSDRNGSDCKEKHKSRKESKYRKTENEKKSRPKKRRRRLQSSSTSG